LNPQPLDHEPSALTTRPWLRANHPIIFVFPEFICHYCKKTFASLIAHFKCIACELSFCKKCYFGKGKDAHEHPITQHGEVIQEGFTFYLI
jgi:hypothetical protein